MSSAREHKSAMISFPTAERLAKDLAGAGVDPNEAQKALAYLRSKRDPEAFFGYLQAIVRDGRAVIRSRQTLNYYRDLEDACQRHLRGMTYEEMALTLGWALRLLRYYRAVEQDAKEKSAEQPASVQDPPQAATAKAASATGKSQRDKATNPLDPELPEIGTVFTGRVIEGDDQYFAIEVPGFESDKVFALLKIEEGVPKYRVGKDTARVKVVGVRKTNTGKIILDVRRAPKQK